MVELPQVHVVVVAALHDHLGLLAGEQAGDGPLADIPFQHALGAGHLEELPVDLGEQVDMQGGEKAVAHPQDHFAEVVGFDLQVAVLGGNAGQGLDVAQKEPGQVEQVALVEQGAAAQGRLGHVEGPVVLVGMPGGQVGGHLGPGVQGPAQGTLGQQLPEAPGHRIEAEAVGHEGKKALVLDRPGQVVEPGQIRADGFFDHQVRAGLGQGQGVAVVQGGGGGHHRAVVVPGPHGFVAGGKEVGLGQSQGRHFLAAVFSRVHDEEAGGLVSLGQEVADVAFADAASAENENGAHVGLPCVRVRGRGDGAGRR